MREFAIIKRLTPGVYLISTDGKRALWTLRKLRKTQQCAATRKRLSRGEAHYGPLGNMLYRMLRLDREYVERAAEPQGVGRT